MSSGDVLLLHPFVAHKNSLNYSSHILYNIFFPIIHKDFESMNKHRAKHMWLGYEGMKGILNEDSVLLVTSLPENERKCQAY